jgi:hypothetical protein
MSFKPDPKPPKTQKKSFKPLRRTPIKKKGVTPSKKIADVKRMYEIFEEIWDKRFHVCEECYFDYVHMNDKEEDAKGFIQYLIDTDMDKNGKKHFVMFFRTGYLGEELLTSSMHHTLEKGRSIFKHLKFEKENIRIKCSDHHRATHSGHISLYEELMRKVLLKHFIEQGKLVDKPYEDYFKS